MSHPLARSGATRRRLAIASAVALLPALAIASGPLAAEATPSAPTVPNAATAAAAKANSVYLSTASTKVKTSSKKKLTLSVYAGSSSLGSGSGSLSVSLTGKGGENHSWYFKLPKKALKVKKSGAGTLKTKKKLGPYGTLQLKLKPKGKVKKSSCKGKVYAKSRQVAVSGKLFFNTKSSGKQKWGKVGSKKKTFKFASPSSVGWSLADYDGSCSPMPEYCPTGITWSAYTDSVYLSGGTRGSAGYIRGSRSAQLAKPKGASRYDSIEVSTPAPKLDASGNGTLTVTGSGTATIKGSFPSTPTPRTCGKKQQTTQFWYGSYTNGSSPLRLKAQVFGSFAVPNLTMGGSFTRTSNG